MFELASAIDLLNIMLYGMDDEREMVKDYVSLNGDSFVLAGPIACGWDESGLQVAVINRGWAGSSEE